MKTIFSTLLRLLTRFWTFVRSHKKASIITTLIAIPVLLIAFVIFKPTQPVYVTAVAKRGDLVQTVEAVGTVISDRDLNLQFPMSGIVSLVKVKEGDKVRAGQLLAQLRSGTQGADVAAAQGRVLSAQAALSALEQGSRPEDIAITEADVDNKRSLLASANATKQNAADALVTSQSRLTALQQEASTSLSGYVQNAQSTKTQQLTVADNSLSVIQDVFSKTEVSDAVIKYGTADYDLMNLQLQSVRQSIQKALLSTSPADFEKALIALDGARTTAMTASSVLDQAFNLLQKLPATTNFDDNARESYKAQIAAERGRTQGAISALDSATKSLRDASANFATRIAAEEGNLSSAKGTLDKATADIATYEAGLRIAEAQLALKRAPARQTDIDSARASLQQARASLAAAAANYGNTVLTAPIDGTVTKVNLKVGEFTPAGPAVTMLGNSPYRIEMFVSEVDIPKVHLSQSGSIELDAFRGTNFLLHVSQIDPAATDKDGVTKYRIRLDFAYPHDDLKIGMTGDASIETGMRKDVISVPLRAVITDDSGSAVRVLNGKTVESHTVVTGMESATGDVEIESGVGSGETIIVLEKK